MKRTIGWLWFYQVWTKIDMFSYLLVHCKKIYDYQNNARVYLDEYENQENLRESYFANRMDYISIEGTELSFQQHFNNTFLRRY